MKVLATHFVMTITRPFGDEYRQIKKVYELEDAYILVHEDKTTHYEKITKHQFLILKANGLEVDKDAPLV